MKLAPTESARRAVEFRRQAAAGVASPASHTERVSISALAREASRGAGRPAQGDVRWYRAVHGAVARRGEAAAAAEDPAKRETPSAVAPPAAGRGGARNARAAIAAYVANMPLAA